MSILNTKDDTDLLCGDAAPLAEFLGVTLKTVYRWREGAPLPAPCRRLLQIRHGDLSGLLGDGWDGYTFGRDGKLYLPGWRGGFDPDQIRAMFFKVQQVRSLHDKIRELERRESMLETDLADAMKKAADYRRLVNTQSKMGMMLERITV
ncbi:MAG: hypothetical protein Q7U78_06000 [Gallionella sp.]|nr:hypothetical protein [Gallionella sp.]